LNEYAVDAAVDTSTIEIDKERENVRFVITRRPGTNAVLEPAIRILESLRKCKVRNHCGRSHSVRLTSLGRHEADEARIHQKIPS